MNVNISSRSEKTSFAPQVMVALTAKKIYGRWKRQQVDIKIDEIV